uniref:Protein preY, mitochondrial n=1 Tax=Astyanax mexicanus TaxID=7994 RepID=A0A3B1KK45_ASTMX
TCIKLNFSVTVPNSIYYKQLFSFFFFRYNKETNELINEELGIAYPIIDGIPNMIPQDAKLIKKAEGIEEPTHHHETKTFTCTKL